MKRLENSPAGRVQAPAPHQLQISVGVFVNGTTGIFLGRLPVAEITHQAEGVVLMAHVPSGGLAHLTLDRPESSEALALLVLGGCPLPQLLQNAPRFVFRRHVQNQESLYSTQPWFRSDRAQSQKPLRHALRHLRS